MNEFKNLLKEAFVGEEPFEAQQGRPELEAAIRKFESQERTLRWMLWFAVGFMGILSVWSAWSFFAAKDDVKQLILFATLFLFANQAIGWAKMFLFSTQKDLSVLKELKRVQLALIERS